MPLEIKVPSVGESITEVMIVKWLKSEGDRVETDDPVAEIETDKATLEIPSPGAGTIAEIKKKENEWADVGEVVATLEEGAGGSASKKESSKSADKGAKSEEPKEKPTQPDESPKQEASADSAQEEKVMPAAKRLLAEKNLTANEVQGTGKGGRILKEDVIRHSNTPSDSQSTPPGEEGAEGSPAGRQEEVVPMSPLRRTVAQRLVDAQSSAALLTTFNEADMSEVIALRKEYGEAFQKKHEVKLGFMSFFVKASIEALKKFPAVNAQIRDKDIVYHNYYDVGIAVSSTKGLVVPVLRNAEAMSLAEIELRIKDFGERGKANKIELKELEGGTFTISNGGVFGSLLSTPIVNPPQSGVLGLHSINDRPVAIDGQVAIRPMMYLALTYDHRIVDGREAVTFLRTIKELIEDPARILLEI
ncbi:MAG: 2-oxoglutarate dehydrogenase complex dihydrolipoyllysine-residue succinyltransferase [Candidatus Omnitrophica bacterium]|nr:2-oxoglutarate dehydrogenase complex dihydrolipoyllysine-residue succinyltransferase [Candidatus Omnitrophota bacterium]